MKDLFAIEQTVLDLSPEERLSIRKEKSIPLIDAITKRLKEVQSEQSLPRSKLTQAIGYYLGLEKHLKNYTLHPDAHISNNAAERAIRPLTLGRKNWLFMGSEKGGKASAILLSLVQTCRNCNVNPQEYLEDVMRKLLSHNSQKLHELLPHEWAKSRS